MSHVYEAPDWRDYKMNWYDPHREAEPLAAEIAARNELTAVLVDERERWGDQAFEVLGREEVQLEVFRHNPRAIAAYRKVGFLRTGAHTEYIPPNGDPLHVVEMAIQRPADAHLDSDEG